MKPITKDMLAAFREAYETDEQAKVLNAAAAKTDLADLAFVPAKAAKLEGPFTIELKTNGITNQERSGRCWCFAGMNILREIIAKKLNVEEFMISNNYLTFYDKLEKANTFLEKIIETAELPLSDRRMQSILWGIGDGNFWDPYKDLVKKYGVVPESAMPETYQSSHTGTFMETINTLLKKDAAILRREVRAGKDVTALKEQMLSEVYKAECIVFGEPVETFDYIYRDKDEQYQALYDQTPQGFYETYVAEDLDDYITVINEPCERAGIHQTLTYQFFGNMADKKVLNLNLSMEEMKALVLHQLKEGEPVWFVCDSDHYGDRKKGIWDQDSFNYGGILGGLDLTMSKEDALDYKDVHGCHAMIFTGVNLDRDGKPDRWKIENSWGSDVGKNGYFVCSDRYFEEFVVEAIVRRSYLNDEQKQILQQTPVEIEPWDII